MHDPHTPAPSPFAYLILRVVPSIERGELLNVGVVLFCRQLGFLGTRVVNITRPIRRSSKESWAARRSIRIGIPRVLNLYSTAPFFRTYFETLGIQKQNVVFSEETTEEMWVEGGKYGSVDPCYPSKVAQALKAKAA